VVGNTFTNSCNDWEEGTYEKFKEWAVRQFGEGKLDLDDEADIPIHRQKSKDMVFKKNRHGHFVLPQKYNFKNNKQKQKVLRGYIGAVYRQ
jgi:hypothetical protein